MRRYIATVIILFALNGAFAQRPIDTTYNFGFEYVVKGDSLPHKWHKFNLIKGFECLVDTAIKHGGKRSLLIDGTRNKNINEFASIVSVIPGKYIGKEIEFRAYLKMQDVKSFAAILIRVDDADHQTLQFSTLQTKKINGTRDWQQYTVKAKLPEMAQWIYVAPILGGSGKLWVDDCQVLIDKKVISEAPVDSTYVRLPPASIPYDNNPSASGHVKLKDADLYYETYGSGEPLLLLHGNSANISAFKYQIGVLAKKFKVIAVDSRGQGKSTDLTIGPLSYDLFAEDMKQLLDSLHINKTNILGWSDGGNTGLIMAIKYPQYVNKLATMGANLFPTTEAVSDTVLREVKGDMIYYQHKKDDHSKMEARLFAMLLDEPHMTFDELKTIKSQVLVMAGEHDLILDKHTRAIASAIPHSRLMIFVSGTHYAPVEIPKEFNETVLKFFEE